MPTTPVVSALFAASRMAGIHRLNTIGRRESGGNAGGVVAAASPYLPIAYSSLSRLSKDGGVDRSRRAM